MHVAKCCNMSTRHTCAVARALIFLHSTNTIFSTIGEKVEYSYM